MMQGGFANSLRLLTIVALQSSFCNHHSSIIMRLYYTDSFLAEFDAEVVEVISAPRPAVVLDRTAFYPTSGGQVFDTGSLEASGTRLRVVEVAEQDDHILTYLEASGKLDH